MTAQPAVAHDEVVAYMMTCKPYGRPPEFYVTKPDFVPPSSTLVPLVPESALQSAHEQNELLANQMRHILKSHNKLGDEIESANARLAAVLSLADRIERVGSLCDVGKVVSAIRRAAAPDTTGVSAGEGDANQGDGE